MHSLHPDTTRARRYRRVPGRSRGRVCGLQCGKMLPRKGCKCTGYLPGFGGAFAIHSMRALKRRRARCAVLFADTCRASRETPAKSRKLTAAITLIYSDRSLSMRVCGS